MSDMHPVPGRPIAAVDVAIERVGAKDASNDLLTLRTGAEVEPPIRMAENEFETFMAACRTAGLESAGGLHTESEPDGGQRVGFRLARTS